MHIQSGLSCLSHSQCGHGVRYQPPSSTAHFTDSYAAAPETSTLAYSRTLFEPTAEAPAAPVLGAWASSLLSAGDAKSASSSTRWTSSLASVPYKCYYCNGSGKCQNDYPGPGSGKDGNGEKEYRCSGSGQCQQCGGDGILLN